MDADVVKFKCHCISNHLTCHMTINSLAPGRFQFNFRWVIFKLTLVNGGWGISYEIALRWMPLDLTDDKSTLVQVMAWCCQATSHYLNQCWPRSPMLYGVTRPQWVNTTHVIYCQIPHIRCTKYLINVSHLVFQLSLPNPLKPGVKSRMQM